MNVLCTEDSGVGGEAEGVKQMSESCCCLFCPLKEVDLRRMGRFLTRNKMQFYNLVSVCSAASVSAAVCWKGGSAEILGKPR